MAFVPARDAEPIPGYRLVEKLGVGGYGEVWKATAPGGLTKAIKIVYGDMAGSRAEQERKALDRIKEVRHPFLLSLERIEVIGNQLFIVMELADGCLADRFYECGKAGLKGVPRKELLAHLRDAAEALDYMTETHDLQHLDVKPQNLLLVGGRIKIADFGLVKNLVGASVTATGGVTPVYATPEAFDGRISRYSDQYSLAIVYQEMLTGVRPFPGTTLMQLAAQHVNSPPLLSPLPPGDRSAIARALSKVPEHRFPSCLQMVEALLPGGQPASLPPALPPGGPSPRPGPRERGLEPPPRPPLSEPIGPSHALDLNLPTLARTALPKALDAPRPSPSARLRMSVPTGKPGLRPTLFLGIGGLAAAALRRFKAKLRDKYRGAEAPLFRLLLVDVDREALRRARQGEPAEALDVAETLLAPLQLSEHYRPESRKFLRWLDRRWFYGIPRSLLTEGLRPLGRLALVDNSDSILDALREALAQITSARALAETVTSTGAEVRDPEPRVFLIASPAGGTGSGMLLSMAYAVRQVLGELGLSPLGLCGLLPYATSPKPAEQELARINAQATLTELSHFSRPEAAYPGDPEHGLQAFGPGHAPFEECYLVHLGEQLGPAESAAATDLLAEYLFLDASPTGGAFFDQFRRQTHEPPRAPFVLRSFGLARVGASDEHPVDLATHLLCQRVTARWAAGPGEAETQFLEREAQRLAVAQGLGEEALAVQQQTAVADALTASPEADLSRLLAAAEALAESDLPHKVRGAIDRLFATGLRREEGEETAWSRLQANVRTSAEQRGAQISRALIDWLVRLIELPGKRLKAAERAATFLARQLAAQADAARDRLAAVEAQRHALAQQLEAAKPAGKLGWLGRALGSAPNAQDKLLAYCHLWLQEMAESSGLLLLAVVQRELAAFRQDVATARQRLGKFVEQFRPALDNELPLNAATAPLHRPDGAEDRLEGAEPVSGDSLPPELVFRFDRSFQGEVLERRGGLWGAFSPDKGPSREGANAAPRALEALREDLLIRARSAILGAIEDLNAAQLFLQTNGGPEKALPVLLAHAAAARPRLRAAGGWEHLVLALPEGQAGSALQGMIATALPDVPATVVPTQEEVILCYEAVGCPLREMVRSAIGPEEVPLDLVLRVMTRTDVAWEQPFGGP